MDKVNTIILGFPILLFCITIHEAAHGWVAYKCGDPTAKMMGRVTLNPLAHIDPFGTFILPLVMMIMSAPIIGWGKPCPVNPNNYRNYKQGEIFVSLGGVSANFVAAFVAAVFLRLSIIFNLQFQVLFLILYLVIMINLYLIIFNLLPIPPLDGSHILREILPYKYQQQYQMMSKYIMFGLLILIFIPYFLPNAPDILSMVIHTLLIPIRLFFSLVAGVRL